MTQRNTLNSIESPARGAGATPEIVSGKPCTNDSHAHGWTAKLLVWIGLKVYQVWLLDAQINDLIPSLGQTNMRIGPSALGPLHCCRCNSLVLALSVAQPQHPGRVR